MANKGLDRPVDMIRHLARVALGHLCVRALHGDVTVPTHAPKLQPFRQAVGVGSYTLTLVQRRPVL